MNRILAVLAVSSGMLFTAVPMAAHHSFAAQYDSNQLITLKGTITKVEWTNPHIYVYVDVKDSNANNGLKIYADDGTSINSTNNNNWSFSGGTRYWIASSAGNWSTAANWAIASAMSTVRRRSRWIARACRGGCRNVLRADAGVVLVPGELVGRDEPETKIALDSTSKPVQEP